MPPGLGWRKLLGGGLSEWGTQPASTLSWAALAQVQGSPLAPAVPERGWAGSPRSRWFPHGWRRVTRLNPGLHSIARPSAWAPLGPCHWVPPERLGQLASLSRKGGRRPVSFLPRTRGGPEHVAQAEAAPHSTLLLDQAAVEEHPLCRYSLGDGGGRRPDRAARRTRWKLRGPGGLPGLLGRSWTSLCSFSGYGPGHTETVPKGELGEERFLLFYLR